MSGDTKPYRQEVDKAAAATKQMKEDISGHLDSLAELFGTNLGTIGQSAEKISSVFVGLTAAFSKAAAGGEAYNLASAQVSSSTLVVAQAEARLSVATRELTILQADAAATAEALAIAQKEVADATDVLAKGEEELIVAQKAQAVATDFGTKAFKFFKIAMASTGIGLLIIGLAAVVTYFTSTMEGANKIKVALSEVGAVITVLKDRFSSLGESLYKFFTGDFKGAAEAMGKVFSGIGAEMANEASSAGDLTKMTIALDKEERENMVTQQERITKSDQLRLAAKEEGVAASEKKKMLVEARDLIKEHYDEEKHVAEGRLNIAIQEAAMHKNMADELTKVEEAKVKVKAIDDESAIAQKALAREMKAVNTALEAQAAALAKKNEEDAKRIKMVNGKGVGLEGKWGQGAVHSEEITPVTVTKEQTKEEKAQQEQDMKDFEKNIKKSEALSDERWRKEQKNIKDTKGVTIDLSDAINGSLNNLGVGVGEFMGNLINGTGGIKSFADMVAGTFADMAIEVGKIAIGMGLATDAIKASLHFGGGVIAIAAGIALVAIGTAVKGRLASVASGGGSGAMSSGGGMDQTFDTRSIATAAASQKISVTVTGKLTADGKGLATALTNENTRVSLAT